jgi:hypothetical protein
MRRRVRRPWFINERTFHQLHRLGRRLGMSRERLLNEILADYFADLRDARRDGSRQS